MPAVVFMVWFGKYLRRENIGVTEYAAKIGEEVHIVEGVLRGKLNPTHRILRALKLSECAPSKEKKEYLEQVEAKLKWMTYYEES